MSSTFLMRVLRVAISRRNSFSTIRNMNGVFFTNRNSNRHISPINLRRRFMSTVAAVKDIGIDELERFQKTKTATIVDVREIEEIQETGILPGAINIPLGDIGKALQEDPSKFSIKYKHAKPSKEDCLVFSCRSGKRSLMAAKTAESLGYTNVLNFAGGWIEWEKHLHQN